MKELTHALASFGVGDRSEFLSVKLRRETINEFLDQHFTHPKVKAHLAFHGAICGYTNDVSGLAIGFPLLVGKIDNWHLCVGGSHRLAHALWRDLAQHGGVMISDAEVSSVVVDDGRAVGVVLAGGEEILARRAVVSTVDVEQTFLSFVDPAAVDAEFRTRVATEVVHKDWTLFSVHVAMSEAPAYAAAELRSRRRPGLGGEPRLRRPPGPERRLAHDPGRPAPRSPSQRRRQLPRMTPPTPPRGTSRACSASSRRSPSTVPVPASGRRSGAGTADVVSTPGGPSPPT